VATPQEGIVMKLVKQMFRLYDLKETQNEGECRYELAPFPDDLSSSFDEHMDYNGVVDEDELYAKMFFDLTGTIYGIDSFYLWTEFTDNMYDAKGKIRVGFKDSEHLEIQDITDRILDLPKHSRLFILVNREFTDHKWVVAVPKSRLYCWLTSPAKWFRRCFVKRDRLSE
jgi:hypothetical protein